jgi:inward rectifier potassium channel
MTTPKEVKYPRILRSDGETDIIRKGIVHDKFDDLYYYFITIPFPLLIFYIFLAYIVFNVVFASFFWCCDNPIANATIGSWSDCFFFSVQTMAAIGYGAMYPQTLIANILVAVEGLFGILSVAIVAGFMFARLSRPRSQVVFSNKAVVMPYEGVPHFIMRVGNLRPNRILEVSVRVTAVKIQESVEGVIMRRFHDLMLVRSSTPIFALAWTIMHPIDSDSPIVSLLNSSNSEKLELIVILSGYDESLSQTIHSRHSYITEEILINHKFTDMIYPNVDGATEVDFSKINDCIPL